MTRLGCGWRTFSDVWLLLPLLVLPHSTWVATLACLTPRCKHDWSATIP
jgi:hypothetical protein